MSHGYECAHLYGGPVDGQTIVVRRHQGTMPADIRSPYGTYFCTPFRTPGGMQIYAIAGAEGSLQLARKKAP